jgi:hypothetical protein
MTSTTWIIGGSEQQKREIGRRVGLCVEQLGVGHVEALVDTRPSRLRVLCAHAWSMHEIGDRRLCARIQADMDGGTC